LISDCVVLVEPRHSEDELKNKIISKWRNLIKGQVTLNVNIEKLQLNEQCLDEIIEISKAAEQQLPDNGLKTDLRRLTEAIYILIQKELSEIDSETSEEILSKLILSYEEGKITEREFQLKMIPLIGQNDCFDFKSLPNVCLTALEKTLTFSSYDESDEYISTGEAVYNLLTDLEEEKKQRAKSKQEWLNGIMTIRNRFS